MIATFPLPPAFRNATELPRVDLERLIEELVTMLDAADGDPDMEPDDEDSCSAQEDNLAYGGDDGLPGDREDAEDGHDREGVEFG